MIDGRAHSVRIVKIPEYGDLILTLYDSGIVQAQMVDDMSNPNHIWAPTQEEMDLIKLLFI